MSLNKCSNCNQEINSYTDLLKLSNNKWYCIECITLSKEIFNLLKVKGYWYYKLAIFTSFIKIKISFGKKYINEM